MSGHAAALLLFETEVSAIGLSGCHHLFLRSKIIPDAAALPLKKAA
jgi:hypothetical protein